MQASVEELKLSTEQVTTQVRRIQAVEKDLKALSDASASKEDISRVRAEMKKLYDGLNVGMPLNLYSLYLLMINIGFVLFHRIP